MDSEQQNEIQRINARYVEETLAGLHPSLTEYITRYPQYADAIADFVTYFHAIEEEIPPVYHAHGEPLPPSIAALLTKTQQRIMANSLQEEPQALMISLSLNSKHEPQDITQLAEALNISSDIVHELDQRLIAFETIPLVLQQAVATFSGYSLDEVQRFFGSIASFYPQTQNVTSASFTHVAETPPGYLSLPHAFLEIVEDSALLSQEQKQYWREVVTSEKKRDADE